jgi:ribosomal protein L7/L12
MPMRSPRIPVVRVVTQLARWRPGSDRQIWLIVLVLVIAICAEAVVIPAKRAALPCAVTGLAGIGMWATGRRRERREREALAAGLAAVSRDDVAAEVIGLAVTGKRIQAIKRYRELTGASIREAKAVIDSI